MNKIVTAYKKEIVSNAEVIDPDNEMDWEDMAFGWAIGKGLSINEAREFAETAIKYQ